jgi:hypothetical protein
MSAVGLVDEVDQALALNVRARGLFEGQFVAAMAGVDRAGCILS